MQTLAHRYLKLLVAAIPFLLLSGDAAAMDSPAPCVPVHVLVFWPSHTKLPTYRRQSDESVKLTAICIVDVPWAPAEDVANRPLSK
jgi:hypothetical protein